MQNFAKVVWSDGAFISPQHLQQLDRYHEKNVNNVVKALRANNYGLIKLVINSSRLRDGTVEIAELQAVFEDGTFFIPTDIDTAKLVIQIPENTNRTKLYLVLLPMSDVDNEVDLFETKNSLTRFYSYDKKVFNTTNIQDEPREVTLARYNVKLQLEDELNEHVMKLPIAIVSSNNDSEVILDKNYIPPFLYSQNEKHLSSYISEVYGLLLQKSNSLATAVNDPNRGGTLEVVDFLVLQTINRYLSYVLHEKEGSKSTHPADLFVNLAKLCADLTTFLPERVIPDMPYYDHNDIATCYERLMSKLRKSLMTALEQRAILIPLEQREENIYIAQTPDKSILDSSMFILAAKANMPSEELRQKLPGMLKVSTIEKIKQLIGFHLSGVKIVARSTAPQELPYHNGYTYFELDKESEDWKDFNDTSGISFHLAGDFPNINFEFWAIKII